MKAVIDRKELLDALAFAATVVSGVIQLGGNNIMLKVADQITIDAWSEGAFMHATINGEVAAPGIVVLPNARLLEVMKVIAADKVEIEADEKTFTATKGKDRWKISVEGDDYASEPTEPFDAIELDERFRTAIAKVRHAVSRDRMRYSVNGINLVCDGKKMAVSAVDGKQLATTSLRLKTAAEFNATISTRCADAILKLFEHNAHFRFGITRTTAIVEAESTRLYYALLEGQFPDINAYLKDQAPEMTFKVDAEKFRTFISAASIFTDAEMFAVALQFGGGVVVASTEMELGSSRVELEITGNMPEVVRKHNPHYLIAATAGLSGEIELGFQKNPMSATTIMQEGYTALVMPVNL